MIRLTLRLILPLLLAAAFTTQAHAHRLKVFAAAEGTTVHGYAFFIGGGRAQDSVWTAKDATGSTIAEGRTDEDGRFSFAVPASTRSEVTVTVDTQEGHIASATLSASRLGGPASAAAAPSPAAGPPDAGGAATPRDTAALVEAAVQRQVEPLMERIEQMDSRLRFTDALSGVFLIFGLAGIALWAKGRREWRRRS